MKTLGPMCLLPMLYVMLRCTESTVIIYVSYVTSPQLMLQIIVPARSEALGPNKNLTRYCYCFRRTCVIPGVPGYTVPPLREVMVTVLGLVIAT